MSTTPIANDVTRHPSRGSSIFLVGMVAIAMLLTSATAFRREWRTWFHPDVAQQARNYLKEKHVAPLQGELSDLLRDAAGNTVATQDHPLMGKGAPDFTLQDHDYNALSLRESLKRGCVVLVFYYGYHCNHCVGQLFAIDDDLNKFHSLGATVIAVSADPSEETRARIAEYGSFGFPVLSDPDNRIATKYGVFTPADGEREAQLQHGTFVINQAGTVLWCNHGDEPFTDNRTLLWEIARASGKAGISAATRPLSDG